MTDILNPEQIFPSALPMAYDPQESTYADFSADRLSVTGDDPFEVRFTVFKGMLHLRDQTRGRASSGSSSSLKPLSSSRARAAIASWRAP